tara:strand:+ start:788 stop:1000 length:213 start_codon:yes stop_codon:yes gene_type:complete
MNDGNTILSVVAQKMMFGDIDEDDALKILENNIELLNEQGIEDKYDALTEVYKMTRQIYRDTNYYEEYPD